VWTLSANIIAYTELPSVIDTVTYQDKKMTLFKSSERDFRCVPRYVLKIKHGYFSPYKYFQ
jgi:hypothetical protein